jgi:hypothetical protein
MNIVTRVWPPAEGEKKTGIIPAISEGHMSAPALYAQTDYRVFEQDAKERGKTLTAKWHHRQELQRQYGPDWKKHLNIPSRSLPTVHLTF